MRPPSLRLAWRSRTITTYPTPVSTRSITSRPGTFANIKYELLSRPPKAYYDYLTPTNSHLLNVSLADQLPTHARPCPPAATSDVDHWTLPRIQPASSSPLLPEGHHLVYFPPAHPTSALLPDGTDADHWPGAPFTRRLWAGGSVQFANPKSNSKEGGGGDSSSSSTVPLRLDGRRAVCVERIEDVRLTWARHAHAPTPDSTSEEAPDLSDGRIFVDVVRSYGSAGEEDELAGSPGAVVERVTRDPVITERRTLVFLTAATTTAEGQTAGTPAKEEAGKPRGPETTTTVAAAAPRAPQKMLRTGARGEVVLEMPFTPTPALLFRFSALSFNAHAIHLNAAYCRSVEGYRERLVHGSLLLVLMLSALRSALRGTGLSAAGMEYRNLEPLYAGEELKVCVARGKTRWNVWVQGPGGRMCVKASAQVV